MLVFRNARGNLLSGLTCIPWNHYQPYKHLAPGKQNKKQHFNMLYVLRLTEKIINSRADPASLLTVSSARAEWMLFHLVTACSCHTHRCTLHTPFKCIKVLDRNDLNVLHFGPPQHNWLKSKRNISHNNKGHMWICLSVSCAIEYVSVYVSFQWSYYSGLVYPCFLSVSLQGPYQRTLLKNLLKDYNPMERPVANDSQPLTVVISLSLVQIMDVVSPSISFGEITSVYQFLLRDGVVGSPLYVCKNTLRTQVLMRKMDVNVRDKQSRVGS